MSPSDIRYSQKIPASERPDSLQADLKKKPFGPEFLLFPIQPAIIQLVVESPYEFYTFTHFYPLIYTEQSAEGTLCPLSRALRKADVEQDWTQYWPLGPAFQLDFASLITTTSSIPWPDPLPLGTYLPCSSLSPSLWDLRFLKVGLSSKDWGKKRHSVPQPFPKVVQRYYGVLQQSLLKKLLPCGPTQLNIQLNNEVARNGHFFQGKEKTHKYCRNLSY